MNSAMIGRAFRVLFVVACALPAATRAFGDIGAPAAAQPAVAGPASDAEATPTEEPEPEVTRGSASIGVLARPSDERIATRLGDILRATGSFPDVRVESRDGVVFLRGRATSAARREWAVRLAEQTEGVAAVVNDLEVPRPSPFSLAPAKAELRALVEQTVALVPMAGVGLALFILCVVLAFVVSRALSSPLRRRVGSALLASTIQKAVWVAIVLTGLYLFFRVAGLMPVAVAIVSGTGLVGLLLGFAFRDIAENFLASILISVQRPFRLGDVIEVAGEKGVVRSVTARGTLIMDFDGNHIQIANATVYKSTIRNFTANPKMRISFTVGIGYDSSMTHAQSVVMASLREHPAVLADPEPLVLVEELGASTIALRVYLWIDGHAHSMLKVKSAVMRLVVRALERAGVSLPDEAREVIFPRGVPVQLERETESHPLAEGETMRVAGDPGLAPGLSEQDAALATDAEGELTSEAPDLERQADRSRRPEEGEPLLLDGAPAR